MITFHNKIITSSIGKWLLPNRLFSISYGISVNGTVTGPLHAHKGDIITVTAVGSTGYILDYITIDNVAITGNTFIMPYSDVTVRAYFKSKYNPLNLPPNTVRVRTNDGKVPYKSIGSFAEYDTATLVPGTSDVYDVYKSGTNFKNLLHDCNNVTEVIGANTAGITDMHFMFYQCSALTSIAMFDTTGVTDMDSMFFECSALTNVPLFDIPNVTVMADMFYYCTSLATVPLFDTSNVTRMEYMFQGCSSLAAIPLFNTSSATNMRGMFYDCNKVQGGALALYRQASTQATPPTDHYATFHNCGSDTVTGAAELEQIPSDWK